MVDYVPALQFVTMKSSSEEVLKWHRLVEFNIKGREPPSAKADTSSGRMLVFRLIPLTPIEREGRKTFVLTVYSASLIVHILTLTITRS